MNPATAIVRREWNGYLNSPVAAIFLIIFLALAGFFTFNVANFFDAGQAELSRSFFLWHPWLYLILVPAVSMGMWADERRNHTLELLLTLPVTHAQAILGKFLAAWSLLGLALLLTFPVPATAAYLGDPDMGVVVSGYIGSFLLAGAYLSLGMWTSSLTRSAVVSFILSVALGLLLILAGFPPVTDFLRGFLPGGLVDLVAGVSFIARFESMHRGVLDFRDLLYFASLIGYMLWLTHLTLKTRATR
jgi:ABC-2 type transport system permease protein